MKTAGLICGFYPHHLDHLAILCIFLNIPLIVSEKEIEESGRKGYPGLKLLYIPEPALANQVSCSYQVIFSCLPKDLFDQIFFISENVLQRKPLNIWVPHGNSDKGHASYFIEALAKEKIALVYGQKMIDLFAQKNVYSQLYATISLGNYRLAFYQRHKNFYDRLVQKEILNRLSPGKKRVLYAPTWEDGENSSSLQEALPKLIKTLPDHWNLILKIHPNTLHQSHEIEKLLIKAQGKKNICIVREFHPIYPLLNAADVYLGDMSSIGYDFLSFLRPMFFLNQNRRDPKLDQGLYLFRCGRVIEKEQYEEIFSLIENEKGDFRKMQKKVYSYVFGKKRAITKIKERIKTTYESYLRGKCPLH